MSARHTSFVAQAVMRDLHESVATLEHELERLVRRAHQLQKALRVVAEHQEQLDKQLLQLPQFKAVGKEQWEEAIAEYSAIQSGLRPALVRLARYKHLEIAVEGEKLDVLLEQANALGTLIAHDPSKPRTIGSIVAALRSAFVEVGSADDVALGDDEPAYYVVGGAFGHTNASMRDLGLSSFQALDDLGLATVADLREAGIRSREEFDAFVRAQTQSADTERNGRNEG
ncbi:uncharacterized protein AMSG_02659 [Thecamonas trahens ATCC 50062]|uniref:Uncharacterized protein n=1 Tax=Thecamonas trahens ATCC 50062 TaxID=461836 RepID=A0A0L0D4I0_THETB|nr:hypothetical protein AMSG_02659 [Thecamonas trahens ATCC 50062]KNC46208.1 hypothetical protein AMSG_02659 [Thecamonas trahens ATCC 50062]|eukprot:XP_013760505.1 hypothetical protein AMSG_02659 [Thecamonas trahens ATCC 50062]